MYIILLEEVEITVAYALVLLQYNPSFLTKVLDASKESVVKTEAFCTNLSTLVPSKKKCATLPGFRFIASNTISFDLINGIIEVVFAISTPC
jgi:hypothetical protein